MAAAWYWHSSAKVRIVLPWAPRAVGRPLDLDEEREEIGEWILATMTAFTDAASLSRKAALWTAASVVLGATSAIVTVGSN
jgi:hypothetical protein